MLYRVELLLRRLIPRRFFEFRYQHLGKLPFAKSDSVFARNLQFAIGPTSEELTAAISVQASPDIYRARIAAGDRFVHASTDGTLVGVCWLAESSYHDIDTGLDFPVEAQTLWLYGAWVRRDWRGEGVYRALLETAIDHFQPQGKREFLVAVDHSNRVSMAVHEHFGTQWIGKCYGLKFLRLGSYRIRYDSHLLKRNPGDL